VNARDYLAAVQQRADAATDGPWIQGYEADGELLPDGTGSFDGRAPSTEVLHVITDEEDPGAYLLLDAATRPDAEFIAASRTDVPRLVAALTAVLDLMDQIEGEDEWYIVHPEDVRGAITTALTPKENDQ